MAEGSRQPYSARNFQLAIDLEKSSIYQLDFLKSVSEASALLSENVVERAIWRYEHLWLPLAAESQETAGLLPAPLDVEYAWHCHLLSPLAYQRDCLALVGKLVDHKVFSVDGRKDKILQSKTLWDSKYRDKAFDYLGLDGLNDRESCDCYRVETVSSQISYDIKSAMFRQKDFYYQVALPHFRDKKVLTTALDRYRRFLYLRQQFPSVFLVPSYDIDLMWHTHQLHPKHYQRDTQLLLGRPFNHDDSVNDRSPGSKLSTAAPETRNLWRDTFGEEFTMHGSMYRGPSPVGNLRSVPVEKLKDLATKTSFVTIKRIEVEGLTCRRVKVDIALISKESLNHRPSSLASPIKLAHLKARGNTITGDNLASFVVNTMDHNGVKFSVVVKPDKVTSLQPVSSVVHYITPDMNGYFPNGTVSRTLTLPLSGDAKLTYVATFQNPSVGPIVLTVAPGQYQRHVLPVDLEQNLGPIPLARLSTEAQNTCEVASHRLVRYSGKAEFTCRIIHSQPQMMSAIQVFYHDKMAAVAHVIGANQLPLKNEVHSSNVPTCPQPPQRAILIKNHEGDWGILYGEWVGMREGIPGKNAGWFTSVKYGVQGDPGHLKVELYKMANRTVHRVDVMGNSGLQTNVDINNMAVNMKYGYMTLNPPYKDVAENIAVGFGIALLHVLCQRRPEDWRPGYSQEAIKRETSLRLIPSERMLMVLAAGYKANAPTNSYLYPMRHFQTCTDLLGFKGWSLGEAAGGCGGCLSASERRRISRRSHWTGFSGGGGGCGDGGGGGCGGGGCGGGGC